MSLATVNSIFMSASCQRLGWAEQVGRRWHFTPEGFLLSNRLIGELLELQEVETLANTLEKIRGGPFPRQDARGRT